MDNNEVDDLGLARYISRRYRFHHERERDRKQKNQKKKIILWLAPGNKRKKKKVDLQVSILSKNAVQHTVKKESSPRTPTNNSFSSIPPKVLYVHLDRQKWM